MANKKISELPYIGVSKISGNTLVPLVTYFSATTGDTVHTYIDDFQTYLISGLTGNTDVFVTGGTYSAGTITFTNNTGGTFNVTGLTTGSTSTISGDYLPLSGGTVTGGTQFTAGLTANTISATTYLNLPVNTDVFVTGGTYSAGTSTFTNNTGGTFTVIGFYTGETSYVNSLNVGVGLSADTTTGDINLINTDPDQVVVLNNGTNINVTGTYPNFTIDVTGLTDFNTFTTGFTYSSNTFTISDNSGNTFDATFTEVTGLTVNGDLNITGTTYSNVISATTYQNLPDNVTGRYLPLSGGTVTGNTTFTSGLTANTLNVTGNTNVRAFTGTTGYISGSGQNVLTVIGSGNSTTSPIFSVQGSSGELFSVTDSLTGSLFSVNDISGLPIMEVFSDNTTLWGSYQAPSLNTTVKTSAGTGSTTVYTLPQSAYTGAFFEYTVSSTSGARAGSIMSIFSGSSVQYTETTTNDIGTTTGLTFSVSANSTNAVLLVSGVTAGWIIKTIVRSI